MTTQTGLQLAQAVPGAEPASSPGGGGLGFFLPLIAFFLIMWALIIRPQQRQQKEHKKMISQIKRGDQVVTSGGLHGRVTGVSDEVLTLEIADRVRVKVNRSAVGSRVTSGNGDKS
jgi:preprotein translocase subunit YajC